MEVRTLQDLRVIVKAQRTTLELSQDALAERAGVSRRWISMFENGHETAEVGKLLAVLDALDIRLNASTSSASAADIHHDPDDVGDLRQTLRDYDNGDF